MSDSQKAIVIGTGVGGLTSALYLLKSGMNVSLFERNTSPGGVACGLAKDGFYWDLGQTIFEGLGEGEQAGLILDELDLRKRLVIRRGERRQVFPRIRIQASEEAREIFWRREKLKELFPGEREGLEKYYKLYTRMMEIMTLSGKAERAGDGASAVLKMRMFLKLLPLLPLSRWNAGKMADYLFRSAELKYIFLAMLADYSRSAGEFPALGVPLMNPEPAFNSRLPLNISNSGRHPGYYHIEGGCARLCQVMAEEVTRRGGLFFYGTAVERILINDERVNGIVTAHGDVIMGDVIFASGGARELFFDLVGPEFIDESFARRVGDLQLIESVFMVHLGIDFDPTPHQDCPVCYYYNAPDMDRAISDLRRGMYHEGRDGFVIYIPSLAWSGAAPTGHHAVTIFTRAPNRPCSGSWKEDGEIWAQKLINLAAVRIPGLEKHIVVKEITTPEDFRYNAFVANHSFGGAAPAMGAVKIPHRTPLKNLWFIGSQSESGAGVNNVMHGAWKAMRQMLKEK